MTQREFYEAIQKANVTEEMKEYALAQLKAMDHANELRREKNAAKAVEREAEKAPIREAIVAVMTKEAKTATTLIAEAGVEIKPQAIPSLLKGLVEAGTIQKVDMKVKGKGTQKGYVLA